MTLRPIINEKIERQKRFFSSKEPGVLTMAIKTANQPNRRQSIAGINWQDQQSLQCYAKSLIEDRKPYIDSVNSLKNDDTVPSIQVLVGTGAVAACYLASPSLFHEETTNYLEPVIRHWNTFDIESIHFDPENTYFKAHMTILKTLIDEWDGSYGIVPFTHFDPLDLANQFRGNDLFTDFYEYPEQLHQLLERCTSCILELEDYIRQTVFRDFPVQERTACGLCLPGGSYLSCDAGDMISPDILKQFGVKHTNEILNQWQGGYLHHHELGIHQIKTWSESPNLSVQFLNRDPNVSHLAEVVSDDIIESSFSVPISFIATEDEYARHSDCWRQGRFAVFVIDNPFSV